MGHITICKSGDACSVKLAVYLHFPKWPFVDRCKDGTFDSVDIRCHFDLPMSVVNCRFELFYSVDLFLVVV